MRIALNLAWGINWIGGAYYVRNIARALASLPPARRPELALLTEGEAVLPRGDDLSQIVDQQISYSSRWELGRRRNWQRSAREMARGRRPRSFHAAARASRADVIFPLIDSPGPGFTLPWIGWLFDLQHKREPAFFSAADRASRDTIFERTIAGASRIVVSSKQARRDLFEFYPAAVGKTDVLTFGVVPDPSWFEREASALAARYLLPSKFIILPNQFWTHKNHRAAFEAVRLCRDELEDLCLVCTGQIHDPRSPAYFPALRAWVNANRLEDHIRILGFIPRRDQVQLVRAACAVLQPSLFEGWSTVVEDARALGKPIFLSDLPVHREQDPPHASYFDPRDPAALAALLRRVVPRLAPGPSASDEQQALTAQHGRILTMAEDLLAVASRALAAPRPIAGPAPVLSN